MVKLQQILSLYLLGFFMYEIKSQTLPVSLRHNDEFNVTKSLEIYIEQNKLQYEANVDSYDKEISNFKESYNKRVEDLSVSKQLLEIYVLDVNAKLNPLEYLNDVSRHCVQKYRYKIPNLSDIKTRLDICANTAANSLNMILSTVNGLRYNLNMRNNVFRSDVTDCHEKFNNTTPENYTLCVTDAVDATNVYTYWNQKSFASSIVAAKCSADTYIRTALECSFNVQNETIALSGETLALTENCIAGLDYCPPCNNDQVGSCSSAINYLSRDSSIEDLQYIFEKYKNLPCVQINFTD